MNDKYKVQLEVFEGPLDLLLHLIKKDEIDIHDIPIDRITKQYLDYLEVMRMLDLAVAGEFVVMAATLMYIKSRELLPPEEQPPLEPDEEDPRLDLVRQLVEYKKFKEIAEDLAQKEALQSKLFGRSTTPAGIGLGPKELDVSIFDLIGAFSSVMKKLQGEGLREIYEETFTVADKIIAIRQRLQAEGGMEFSQLFEGATTKPEMIAMFLAILELMRLKEIRGVQDKPFGPIVMELRK